jgi:hypothetical protein
MLFQKVLNAPTPLSFQLLGTAIAILWMLSATANGFELHKFNKLMAISPGPSPL